IKTHFPLVPPFSKGSWTLTARVKPTCVLPEPKAPKASVIDLLSTPFHPRRLSKFLLPVVI
ncbi:MAG: hypothetical protein Q8P81_04280, partial [Nanoarchaeota archaeon]|nr:hypothetical protein [Nanoarchaeota archaeon]